jgi:N utilization substance protein B
VVGVARRPVSRKQARRDALFVLYQHEVTSLPVERLMENLGRDQGYAPDEFTERLVAGVLGDQERLDETLTVYCRSWPLSRLAPLERSTLRLALFEMQSGETPTAVAIAEAVRLIKRYASGEAGALVNGILGAIQKEQEGDGAQD